jgi:hypothetical protein
VYTGLIDFTGARKPAWYAFAGGNRITIDAPQAVAPGEEFAVSGVLTTRQGPGEGIRVRLQRRSLTGTTWRTVVSQTTGADGAYAFEAVTQTSGKRYRVVWDGVRESLQVTVAMGQ